MQRDQKVALGEQQEESLRQSRIWLGGIGRDLEFEKNRKLHTAGTCEWILESDLFNSWILGEVDILLINGIPGAGKSVLQSFILHQLQQRSKTSRLCGPILFFFFKNGNLKTESPVTMMATLIDQLIQQYKSPQLVDLLNAARKNSNTQHCVDFKQLWDLFFELVNALAYGSQNPRVSILIDALDECSDREDLMSYIADLKPSGVNFLITSRAEDDIMEALTSTASKCSMIKLTEEYINLDIIRFLEDQIKTKKYKQLQQFRELLIQTLPKKAQGMFRYAALLLEELLKPSAKDVKRTIASIPSGLNNMYIWILEHLSPDLNDLQLRKTVFNWVALAFRPITVDEMALAFAAYYHDSETESTTKFDPTQKILVSEGQMLKACGPLVEVTEEGTISFTHFSVKEFLLITSEERNKKIPYSCTNQLVTECLISDTGIAHGSILKACMTQLLSSIFLDTLAEQTNEDNTYSVRHWFEHATRSDVQLLDSREIQEENIINPWPAVCEFLSSSNQCFFTWIKRFPRELWSLRQTPLCFERYDAKRSRHPMDVAAAFGLQIPLKRAMESAEFKECSNIGDHKGVSPLSYAASLEKTEVTKLPIEAGTQVDSKHDVQRAPLSYAAASGQTEVVKFLIEAGAEVDSKDNLKRTPLYYAARYGHTEIVKWLIKAGAQVESKDSVQRTPLLMAAMFRHTEVVKLLIEAGAEIDRKDKFQTTPLSYAASGGSMEVVKLLIEAGADVDSEDKYQQTPVYHAALRGAKELVELLIQNGAKPEVKDEDGKTPSERTHMMMVQSIERFRAKSQINTK